MADSSGGEVHHCEYFVYGKERYNEAPPAFNVSHRYTGQVFDEATGLYYYNARYYDPEIGRFIQPDTFVPTAADPQTLNRYSYCHNNPLNATDPSGHMDPVMAVIVLIVVAVVVNVAVAAASGGNVWQGMAAGAAGAAIAFAASVAISGNGERVANEVKRDHDNGVGVVYKLAGEKGTHSAIANTPDDLGKLIDAIKAGGKEIEYLSLRQHGTLEGALIFNAKEGIVLGSDGAKAGSWKFSTIFTKGRLDGLFAKGAKIDLEFCNSAADNRVTFSLAADFKNAVPQARVFGFSAPGYPWPFTDVHGPMIKSGWNNYTEMTDVKPSR